MSQDIVWIFAILTKNERKTQGSKASCTKKAAAQRFVQQLEITLYYSAE